MSNWTWKLSGACLLFVIAAVALESPLLGLIAAGLWLLVASIGTKLKRPRDGD